MCVLGIDAILEEATSFDAPYTVGDELRVKPSKVHCDHPYERHRNFERISKVSVEIDDVLRDLRPALTSCG